MTVLLHSDRLRPLIVKLINSLAAQSPARAPRIPDSRERNSHNREDKTLKGYRVARRAASSVSVECGLDVAAQVQHVLQLFCASQMYHSGRERLGFDPRAFLSSPTVSCPELTASCSAFSTFSMLDQRQGEHCLLCTITASLPLHALSSCTIAVQQFMKQSMLPLTLYASDSIYICICSFLITCACRCQ